MDRKVRRKAAVDLGTMVFGKVPPQAKELEEVVLGAMMLEPRCISDVKEILRPEHFYVEAHQRICKVIFSLENTSVVDSILVMEELKAVGDLEFIGGPYYLTKLTTNVVSSAHVVHHAIRIKDFALARKLIQFSGEVIGMAYEDEEDFRNILSHAEQSLFDINFDLQSSKNTSLDQIAFNLENKLFNAKTEEEQNAYTYTLMPEWDHINGPLFSGLFIVAARPAMGKTAFVVDLIAKMAKKYPVGFINIEMTEEQIGKRFVSNIQKFDNDLFKKEVKNRTKEEREEIAEGLRKFTELALYIESETAMIDRIINKLKFWKKKFGIRLGVIDFLQLIDVEPEMERYMTDVQKLNYILKQLRSACKKIDLPIILLCQLNRELYKRGGNKEPGLSDLKGSGTIEELAYQISFLHRPEYYGITEDDNGESTEGLLIQIIAKHRDGALGRLKYLFQGEYSKLDDWLGELGGWKPMAKEEAKQGELPLPDEDLPF